MRLVVIMLVLLSALSHAVLANDPKELVFVFQKLKDPTQIKAEAQRLGELLSAELGMPVRTMVPTDYSASVQALVSKQADYAFVSAIPFLLARRDGGASILLVESRTDTQGVARTDYDSILVVAADSPLKTFDDFKASSRELRMAFTSPTSYSGYIMPYARLVDEGMLQPRQDVREIFKTVAFAGSYTLALEQVIAGRADVAAVSDYTMEGPHADSYLNSEQRSRLRILARTPGVPTHLICARGGLSDELNARVKAAILKIAANHTELLSDVYGATSFVEVDEDRHVKRAIQAVEFIGLPIEGLAR